MVRISKIIYSCFCPRSKDVEVDCSSKQQRGKTFDYLNKVCLKCGRKMESKIVVERG